ncbi:MAG: heparan-alpha-glucosaminide N-acetyltransferase domain-containing protein [Bacilli bacterium]
MKKRQAILTKNINPNKPKRIFEIDFLRCLPIIVVMLYHLCFDFSSIPGIFSNYYTQIRNYPMFSDFIGFCTNIFYEPVLMTVIAPLVGGIFIFLSGVSSSFTRSNLRRGLLMSGAAIGVSLFTWLVSFILSNFGINEDLFIGWGVIHLMAFSILLYGLIELIFEKILKRKGSPLLLLIIGVLILMTGIILRSGIYLNGEYIKWPVSSVSGGPIKEFETDPWAFVLSALGYYSNTVDFWPILPYTGVFFIGVSLGKAAYKEKKTLLPKLDKPFFKPFCFIGRHTLWFYALHQVVYIIVLAIVLSAMGFTL